jgi:hypothetical protein
MKLDKIEGTIGFQLFGGIGDALICSSISTVCPIEMYVKSHQVPLLNEIEGVSAFDIKQRRNPDKKLNMEMLFATVRGLRDEEYYGLVEERIGQKVQVPKFKFPAKPRSNRVFLHATPSDVNRRWVPENWTQLAYNLREHGKTVYFLGTKVDFGFTDEKIYKLSDISDDLVWQSKKLSTGLFVGVDSGFCHIAGILGVPGAVIFTNTKPENVVARYNKLRGITPDNFHPSQICGRYCENSRKYANAITTQQVMDILGEVPEFCIENTKTYNFPVNLPVDSHIEIGIIGNRGKIQDYLPNVQLVDGQRHVTLYPKENGQIVIKTPTTEKTFIASLEHLHRAINEVLVAKC